MHVLKSMLAIVALLFAASAAPALAAPDSQSVFELLQGKAYDEIYSTLDNRGRSVGNTTITCLVANSSENCDLDYYGFTANDLNGDGSSVVGNVNYNGFDVFSNTDGKHRTSQAAVWNPTANAFVLLEDSIYNPDSPGDSDLANIFNIDGDQLHTLFEDSPFANNEYETNATDISSGTQRVVGYARGFFNTNQYGEGSGPSYEFILPLSWSQDGEGWSLAEVLPVFGDVNAYDAPFGFATAISDSIPDGLDREYVVGMAGSLLVGTGNYPTADVSTGNAALWTHTVEGWKYTNLNHDLELYSGAEDVNDLGQVVGWAGNMFSIDDYFGGWDGWGQNGANNWKPSAVIWLPNADQWDAHVLSFVDQQEVSYNNSDATAIANDGSVAVGWVAGPGENELAQNAAAWIPTDAVWTSDSLVNLQTHLSSDAKSGALGVEGVLVGSVAEGVDQHGRLVVGKGFYSGDTDFTSALYWELDADGQVVASGNLEQALAAAGVPMDGKDLTLTDARAVRVVYDTDGNPTDVYITGTGVGSFGSWIATLSGITTPDSISKGPKVVKKATDDVASVLGGIADDQYCRRPTGTSVADAPWCYFVVGVAGGEVSNNAYGLGLAKTVGIAKYTDESTSFGATGGLSVSHGHVEGGSSYTALTATVGAYADHSPETGLQGRASIVLGRIIDATFNRVYVNGASTSTSTGSTSGFGAGFFGRVGYASSLDEATRTIPFIEVRLATVNLDAFTDTGGTFNGAFDATTQTSGSIRIGIDGEHALNAQTLLTGGVSVTAAATTGTGVNATIAAQQFVVSGTGFTAYASGNIGVIYQIDSTSSFTGQTTGFVGLDGLVGGSVLAKYSKVF